MKLFSSIPRSISLSAQLLLTFVLLVAAAVTALTLVAYDTAMDDLLARARREATLAARTHAELVNQLLALRERRTEGFLASADKVCGEPAGGIQYAWAEPCLSDLLREFRASEGAAGVSMTRGAKALASDGEAVALVPPEGEPWIVVRTDAGLRYVLRVSRGLVEVRVAYDATDVHAIFETSRLGAPRTAYLLDVTGDPLAPGGYAPGQDVFVAAAARCWTTDADVNGEVEIVDFAGRQVIEGSVPVEVLPDTCVAAHVDYRETSAPAAQLRRDLVLRGVTFILVGVLLSLVAARHIAAPVQRLADSARVLQAGDFDVRIPSGGPSEVRGLSKALVAMRNDLADLVAREQAGRREAEAANRSKDQFLAMLSHELRTPLTAVLGWAHTLHAAAAEPARVRRAANAIQRSAEAQRRLIEDLLDVAGIAAGRVRMAPVPTVIDTVVEAAVDALTPQAEDKRVALTTSFDDPGLVVYADPERLQQIIWNVTWNGVKYTPPGGRVHLRIRAVGGLAELSVKDTGMGIDPEFLPHVFGWFRREEGGELPAHEGLGLGLALVRQLVELHGGNVRAESAGRGHGSTFIITFPLYDEGATTGGQPAGGARQVSLASMRVLVVDDDAGSREAVRVLLEQVGAEVATAASAAEARRQLGTAHVDVIVSDIAMAQESGYSLMQALRADGFTTPGIALTGYARREDADRAYAAGFDVHLPKPVDPEVLVTVLAAVARRDPT